MSGLKIAAFLPLWIVLTAPATATEEVDTQRRTDYRIGPGDLLDLTFFGIDELNQSIRVSNSGKIHVPHLGVMLVDGVTPIELEAKLAKELQDRKLVKNALVQVIITEFRAQPFYILGEVDMPGQYVMTDQTYLVDAITMAGGLGISASRWGYLYRRNETSALREFGGEEATGSQMAAFEIFKIDLRSLVEGDSPELDLTLRGGDFLYVPEKKPQFFYVVGDVFGAGGYELPEDGLLLATQALSTAGGPTRTAKISEGILVRFAEDGSRQEIAVDFNAILRGKKADFPIRHNDVIFVPGSAAKTIGYGLLGMIPGMTHGAIVRGSIQGSRGR